MRTCRDVVGFDFEREGDTERVGTHASETDLGRDENVENAQRGKTDHSATGTMDSVRGFLKFHMSFSTKINFASEGLPRNV